MLVHLLTRARQRNPIPDALGRNPWSVQSFIQGSSFFPGTSMIRPIPTAAQARIQCLRILVVSNTRLVLEWILSSIKTGQSGKGISCIFLVLRLIGFDANASAESFSLAVHRCQHIARESSLGMFRRGCFRARASIFI